MRKRLVLSFGLLALGTTGAAPMARAHDQIEVCKSAIIATEPVRNYGSSEQRLERTRLRAIEHWRGHVLDRYGVEFADWEAAADKHFHCRDDGQGGISCRLTGQPCLASADLGVTNYRYRRWGFGGWRR